MNRLMVTSSAAAFALRACPGLIAVVVLVLAATAAAPACIDSDRRRALVTELDSDAATDATSDDAVTLTSPPDVSPDVDDDASGCPGCFIAGECYSDGSVNAHNSCEICRPRMDPTDWSAIGDARSCDAGPCTGPGTCVGRICEAAAYPVCPPPQCVSAVECQGDTCDLVVTPGFCVIDGMCVAATEPSPNDVCAVCDPDRDLFQWSPALGQVCDDGDVCTDEDACQVEGCRGITNTCEDAYACTLDFCDDGCKHNIRAGTCLIQGACYQEGEQRPGLQCYVCDPDHPDDWTLRAGEDCDDGSVCTIGDSCGQTGLCKGEIEVVGSEPNQDADHPTVLGAGIVTYPVSTIDGNLNPLVDVDWYQWGMPINTLDGIYRPKAAIKSFLPDKATLCVFALCGQSAGVFATPVVTCEGSATALKVGMRAGCCVEVGASSEATVSAPALCVGNVVQGFGTVSVMMSEKGTGNVDARCGDYELTWGAVKQ